MRLHGRGVDQHFDRWPASRGQGMKHVRPDAFGDPAHRVAIFKRRRVAGAAPSRAGIQRGPGAIRRIIRNL
jgi:hypothetical protein